MGIAEAFYYPAPYYGDDESFDWCCWNLGSRTRYSRNLGKDELKTNLQNPTSDEEIIEYIEKGGDISAFKKEDILVNVVHYQKKPFRILKSLFKRGLKLSEFSYDFDNSSMVNLINKKDIDSLGLLNKHGLFDTKKKVSPEDVEEVFERFLMVEGVDEIVSRHLFEHLTHEQITILLLKLWRILKPGGKLEITVPNFQQILFYYEKQFRKNDFSNLDILHSRIFGIGEEGLHKTIWSEKIGIFYLVREDFFTSPIVLYKDNDLEITFKTKKKCVNPHMI